MSEAKFNLDLVAPYHPALLAYLSHKAAAIPLEESVRAIQGKGRKVRPLLGPNSIMERTLGLDAIQVEQGYQFNPATVKRTYFDVEKNKESETEFAEAEEAATQLVNPVTGKAAVAALLEIGDIEYQVAVIRVSHSDHPQRAWAMGQFTRACYALDDKLRKVGLDASAGIHLGIIKYALRGIVLNTDKEFHNQPNKDVGLENAVCLYEFIKKHPEFAK